MISFLGKKFNLSSVLGYLFSGMIIGENGLGYINSAEETLHILSEIGVVFLLFIIGLEMSYKRMIAMKRYMFLLGGLQFVLTAIGFFIVFLYFPYLNLSMKAACIIAVGFSLSSTSVVLQILKDKDMQSEPIGKISLGILLFQDIMVVPILVIMQFIAIDVISFYDISYEICFAIMKAIFAMVLIFLLSHLLHPLIKSISYHNVSFNHEIFISLVFLIIFSAVFISDKLELQATFGGFIAGMLLSENEFKHYVEKSIISFKGLFLGLFFLTVGMRININVIYENLFLTFTFTLMTMILKALLIFIIIIYCTSFKKSIAFKTAVLLSQGSEFGFVIFDKALNYGILTKGLDETLLASITLSITLTPLLFELASLLARRYLKHSSVLDDIKNTSIDLSNHVVILGYGEVGQIIAEQLSAHDVEFIVLESDESLIKEHKDRIRIHKANGSNLEALMSANIEKAKVLVVTFANHITVERLLVAIETNLPNREFSVLLHSKKRSTKKKFLTMGASDVVLDEVEIGKRFAEKILKKYELNNHHIEMEE